MQTHTNTDGSDQVYMLRIWRSDQDESWHAALESVSMNEHHASTSMEDSAKRFKRLNISNDSIRAAPRIPRAKRLAF